MSRLRSGLPGTMLGPLKPPLRVPSRVSRSKSPFGFSASAVRNLMRLIDLQPLFTYAVGITSIAMTRSGKRLGDIVAGTMVVHAIELPAGQQVPTLAAVPLPVAPMADEQAALVEFAERSGQLTLQRQEELANLLTPLTGRNDSAGVRQLIGHANWLLGRP